MSAFSHLSDKDLAFEIGCSVHEMINGRIALRYQIERVRKFRGAAVIDHGRLADAHAAGVAVARKCLIIRARLKGLRAEQACRPVILSQAAE